MSRFRYVGAHFLSYADGTGHNARTVAELGERKVGIFEARPDSSWGVSVVDCEEPDKVLATASVPALLTDSGATVIRQSLMLGTGRCVVLNSWGSSSVFSLDEGGEVRVVDYRDGVASVGPSLALGTAQANLTPIGTVSAVFMYRLSGSRFRMIISDDYVEGYADFTVAPNGAITRTPFRLTPARVLIGVGWEYGDCMIHDGRLYTFVDRIRSYDAQTLEAVATSDYTAPDGDYRRAEGFRYVSVAPDGRIQYATYSANEMPSGPDVVVATLWSVDPVTLARVSREVPLPPPSTVDSDLSDWVTPAIGPWYSRFGPTGDHRSKMGVMLMAGVYTKEVDGARGQGVAGYLLGTGEAVGAVVWPAGAPPFPDFQAGSFTWDQVFYTRDNYAIILDTSGDEPGRTYLFWSTNLIIPPDDTARPLSSYSEAYFS